MKLLKGIFKFIGLLITTLLAVLLLFYFMAPIYKFSGQVPFKGEKLYNPYDGMNPDNWKKYNFQVQSYAWGGLTNGRKNSNRLIDSVYNLLGFDYVATSDYQRINYHDSDKPYFIPTYEHGYNIFKTHQVCIGSDEVLWIDLFFFQTTGMKQWVIDRLRPHNKIVALAHPKLRDGYTFEDLRLLTNYDLIEVLNNFRISTKYWDVALSSGQPAFILSNDDAHDVLNQIEVGTRFTMINSSSTNGDEIIYHLKSGNAYGVDFRQDREETIEQKAAEEKKLPFLKVFDLKGDTIIVKTSKKAKLYRFIRQNSDTVLRVSDTDSASYIIKTDDEYVRTEIAFDDGTTFYLNPVIRYSGDKLEAKKQAKIDVNATSWLRIFYFVMVVLIFWYFTRKIPGKASREHK